MSHNNLETLKIVMNNKEYQNEENAIDNGDQTFTITNIIGCAVCDDHFEVL